MQQACQGRSEEGAPEAEQLGAGDQRDERCRRVNPHRLAHDARTDDVALDDVDDDEVGEDKERQHPALEEGDQHAHSSGDEHPHNGDELHEEREHAQECGIADVQDEHPGSHEHTNERRQRQRPPNIATDHLVHGRDEQARAPALSAGGLAAQPLGDLGSIGGEVHAEDQDQDDVDERADDP